MVRILIIYFFILKAPWQWESWMTSWCFLKEHSLILLVYQEGRSIGKEATGIALKDTKHVTLTQTSIPEVCFKLLWDDWKVDMYTEGNTGEIMQVALVVRNSPAGAGRCGRRGFDPWVGKIPWRRARQPTPVFLPGKSHGQRSLVGSGSRHCKGQTELNN